MRENKGVTLINMMIIIIVLVIISSVSIIGGREILQNSKNSKKEENLAAVKSVVNQISIKQGTSGVLTPSTAEIYGKSAVGVLSGDESSLEDWYILDEEELEKLGVEYIEESYLVNYEKNKVYAMSEYLKDMSIILDGKVNGGDVENPTILTGTDGSVVNVLTSSEIEALGNAYLKSSSVKMVVKADADTGVVPIPTGFDYLEGTEKKGLVIKDSRDNEFVWIPVSDVTTMYESGAETSMNHADSNFSIKTDKWGKGSFASMSTPNSKSYREPAVVVGNDGTRYDATDYAKAGSFSSLADFAADLKNEFNGMIESVGKYGGFYVGRYELGYDSGVVCRKGVSVLTASTSSGTNYYGSSETSMWYGLYKACKSFTSGGAKSSMIWGCQWDAMVNFIGNHRATAPGSVYPTGADEYNDKAKNVYDTSTGGVYEWMATASSTYGRASRAGLYNAPVSSSSRGRQRPDPYPQRPWHACPALYKVELSPVGTKCGRTERSFREVNKNLSQGLLAYSRRL